MKTTTVSTYSVFLWSILLFSCVPKKKYDLLLEAKDVLQKDLSLLQDARRERNRFADSLSRLNTHLTNTQAELEDWKNRYISYETLNRDLNKEVESLRQQNIALQESARNTNDAARKDIADRLKELDARERELRQLESSLRTSEGTVQELRQILSEKELRIRDMSDTLKQRENEMMEIRQKIAQILRGVNANDWAIEQKNGRIHIQFSEAILFAKGKSDVNPKGIDVLRRLASALNSSPSVEIQVEGHTDSDGSADLNWQLSATRAISVSKILIANKVEPNRLSAIGRAFYQAIAPNDSEVNKARNRRTEIILSPRLDALYNLIQNK